MNESLIQVLQIPYRVMALVTTHIREASVAGHGCGPEAELIVLIGTLLSILAHPFLSE